MTSTGPWGEEWVQKSTQLHTHIHKHTGFVWMWTPRNSFCKPNVQCDDIRRWVPWEIFRSWEWNPQEWILEFRRSQDGGGVGRGDHFLFYKFIERTKEWWTKFTKQLLIASSGHQAPRKAAHCLRREVGQKY